MEPRTPAEVLELAAALKRENPERTAAQVATILRAHAGWAPNEGTLQRHFARLELTTRPDGSPPAVFGRFEASAPNELWTGDALHGPVVDGRRTYLFAFIDDHSRVLVGHRWGYAEDTVRLEAALRAALAFRGVPQGGYVDNGSAFVDAQLLRACASLGIRLVHSRPGKPEGRGKIERLFRTVRDQFLVELDTEGHPEVADLVELNRLFTAWVETVYHRRTHTETGEPPLQRWLATEPPALPTPEQLHEAFLWSEQRTVTKTATVSLHGNVYEVDARAGRPEGGAGLRPVRPHHRRGSLPGPADGTSHPAPDRPARPRQGPPRDHTRVGAGDRDRLPAPGRGHPTPPRSPTASATPTSTRTPTC